MPPSNIVVKKQYFRLAVVGLGFASSSNFQQIARNIVYGNFKIFKEISEKSRSNEIHSCYLAKVYLFHRGFNRPKNIHLVLRKNRNRINTSKTKLTINTFSIP
jgi:hypothetical protein